MSSGRPPKPLREWKATFLEELRATSDVKKAARVAGVSASHAYNCRNECGLFADEWREAILYGIEEIEAAFLARCRFGVEKPLSHQGKLTGDAVTEWNERAVLEALRAYKRDVWGRESGQSADGLTAALLRIVEDASGQTPEERGDEKD